MLSVGVIQLDSEFIFFLQTEAAGNPWAITQQLYATAVQWHKQKEENPESPTNPMRNILLYNLYNALLMKLEALEVDQELMDTAKARGLIEGTTYLYLQWDPATRRHVRASMQSVEHADMVQMVKTLKYLATFPNVIGISCTAENGGQPQRGYYPLFPRRPEPDRRIPPAMDAHEQVAAQQHLALHRCHDEAAKPGRSPLAKYVERVTRQF